MTKKKTNQKKTTTTSHGGKVPYPSDTPLPIPKVQSKKKVSNKPTKKVTKKRKDIIKEITTVEETRSNGGWIKTTTVKYIKQLLCPAFLKNETILTLAAIPLAILILIVLWRITNHE